MTSFREFNDAMAVIYVDFFNKYGEEYAFKFLLNSGVASNILNELYCRFIKEGIPNIESIPQEQKEKFWKVACQYFTELPDRLKASKSIYVLHLITSN